MIIKKQKTPASVPARNHPLFIKEIEDVIQTRLDHRKDSPLHPQRTSRITAGIVRHKNWKTIKEDLIRAELPDIDDGF